MANEFVTWLTREADKRGWSNSELARRAGLAPATVSLVISGQRRAGWDFCAGIARAFGIEPDNVFRRAGLLPPLPESVAEGEEAKRIIRSLPDHVRSMAMRMLRSLAGAAPLSQGDAVKDDPLRDTVRRKIEAASPEEIEMMTKFLHLLDAIHPLEASRDEGEPRSASQTGTVD